MKFKIKLFCKHIFIDDDNRMSVAHWGFIPDDFNFL